MAETTVSNKLVRSNIINNLETSAGGLFEFDKMPLHIKYQQNDDGTVYVTSANTVNILQTYNKPPLEIITSAISHEIIEGFHTSGTFLDLSDVRYNNLSRNNILVYDGQYWNNQPLSATSATPWNHDLPLNYVPKSDGIGGWNRSYIREDSTGLIRIRYGTNINEFSIAFTSEDATNNALPTELAVVNYVSTAMSARDSFFELIDTPSSPNANRILYESSAAVVDSSDLTWNDSTKLMYINGKVGIGYDNPSDKLYVREDHNAPTQIDVVNEGTGTGAYAGFYAKANSVYGTLIAYDDEYTGYTEFADKFTLRSVSGNLVLCSQSVANSIEIYTGGVASGNKQITIDSAGVMTWINAFPITPSAAPTTDYMVANKKYVDDQIGGVDTFLELTDTISSYNANRILYESSAAVVDNANFIYDGSNLSIGKSSFEGWTSAYTVLQFGGNASFYADVSEGSSKYLYISQNVYNDGTNKRISSGNASRYTQYDGTHEFFIGSDFSEDPDDPITFHSRLRMTYIGVIVNDDKENLNFQIKGASNDNLVLVDTNSETVKISTNNFVVTSGTSITSDLHKYGFDKTTLENWVTTIDVLSLGKLGSFYTTAQSEGAAKSFGLVNNGYINSGGYWNRVYNDEANNFYMKNGNFYFQSIDADTEDTTFSFIHRMFLTAYDHGEEGAQLGLGTTSPMLNVGSAAGDFTGDGIHVKSDIANDRVAFLILEGESTTSNPAARLAFADQDGETNEKLCEFWWGSDSYGSASIFDFRTLDDDTSSQNTIFRLYNNQASSMSFQINPLGQDIDVIIKTDNYYAFNIDAGSDKIFSEAIKNNTMGSGVPVYIDTTDGELGIIPG